MIKQPTPDPTRSKPDRFAQAGRIARRLAALDEEESAELAASPTSIRSKFEKKRAGVLEGVAADVKGLVDAMRATKKGGD
jgi:hypothetical protein